MNDAKTRMQGCQMNEIRQLCNTLSGIGKFTSYVGNGDLVSKMFLGRLNIGLSKQEADNMILEIKDFVNHAKDPNETNPKFIKERTSINQDLQYQITDLQARFDKDIKILRQHKDAMKALDVKYS